MNADNRQMAGDEEMSRKRNINMCGKGEKE